MAGASAVVEVGEMDLEQIAGDFSEQLEKLEEAITATGKAQDLADRVSSKGFWKAFGGGLNGASDKELAECVSMLGGSLETTQQILQLMLQVGQTKNAYLKCLHQVIVDKICSLEDNTGDLDVNQQKASEATLVIARKIKEQLEERIAHEETILRHDKSITKLKKYSKEKDVLDTQQSAALDRLHKLNEEKDIVDGEQTRLINDLQSIAEKKDALDAQQSQELQQIRVDITRLEEMVNGQAAVISLMRQDKGGGILRVLAFVSLGMSVAAIILALVV